jgi:hypothetical protein
MVDVLGMEVIRRVHMGAVMSGKIHLLERPALTVRQILGLEAGETFQKHPGIFLAGEILDLWPHVMRIEDGIVVERDRNIDHSAGHLH